MLTLTPCSLPDLPDWEEFTYKYIFEEVEWAKAEQSEANETPSSSTR